MSSGKPAGLVAVRPAARAISRVLLAATAVLLATLWRRRRQAHAKERLVRAHAAAGCAPSPATTGQSKEVTTSRPGEGGSSCPICMEAIDEDAGVMRCCNSHYFHEGCLREWIRHRAVDRGATCPLCRGSIQVNARRLRAFLDGNASLSADARGFFERVLAQSAGGNLSGWVAVSGISLVRGQTLANAAWGFYSGWTGRPWGVAEDLVSELQRERMRVAIELGWALGIGARAVGTWWRQAARHNAEDAERSTDGARRADGTSSP
eukprot:5868116-Prymnesium_polylepis.1